jgi:hypothetical protein
MLPLFRVRQRKPMTARRTYILAGLVIASLFCRAESPPGADLTLAEYRAELDQLATATQQLDSSGHPLPPILKDVPPSWRVQTDQQTFEISAEGLQRDVRRFEKEQTPETAKAIRSRIQTLRDDLDGFQSAPQDVSSSRDRLTTLLARPEFSAVRGPSSFDRFKQRLIAALIRMLELLFRSSAIPIISKFFVYGLIGLAVLTLGFIAYRQITSASQQEKVVPTDLPVSARSWSLWLAEAQAAAAQHNWRQAIHLAYWAGISFLEHEGAWRPDRARTPREYLRLLSSASKHREALAELTQVFELTWYAKRRADAGVFSQTIRALERLGCQPS